MGTPVRVNEDNYVHLEQMAKVEGRSVTNMLNRILDERFGRNTGSPIKTTPTPVKTEAPDVSDLFQPEITPAADVKHEAPDLTVLEQACCQNEFRPCRHWVWDSTSGEGYKNTLSGRFREAE